MFHHVSETLSAALILKDAQSAGLRRKDCKIHSDAFVPSAVFQNNMPVHYAAASRLRRAGENRPVSLCGCRKDEKENGAPKSHVSGCRLPKCERRSQLGLTTVFLQQSLKTRIAPQRIPNRIYFQDLDRHGAGAV